ncbi:MAG: response regulator [Nitrospirae bacterium]|nr:response regulator [Nitrospirota bacterium]
MKHTGKSIRMRVITPIFVFSAGICLILFLIILDTSHKVSVDYLEFIMADYGETCQYILDSSVTELISARLLDNPIVAEAKQKEVVSELSEYWKQKDLQGMILSSDGSILYSSVPPAIQGVLSPFAGRSGYFHAVKGFEHINGYVVDFPAWHWKVVMVRKPLLWVTEIFRKELAILVPVILFGISLLIMSIFVIIKRNFQRPVENIINDLRSGKEVRETGISEMDTIVAAINDSILGLRQKTEHIKALHDIALSLHDQSRDVTINAILEKVNSILGAEFAALVLYGTQGDLKNIFSKNSGSETPMDLHGEQGVLEYIKTLSAPERINDVSVHPGLQRAFSPGTRIPQNMIATPIFSEDKSRTGVLLFLNKPGGFTGEDEVLLSAVSADAAVTISKAENLMQLMRFKQVIDSSFDVVAITGKEREISYVNPACETLTGYTVLDLMGKKLDVLFGVPQAWTADDVWERLRSDGLWRGEFMNRRKNGDTYYASTVIFLLPVAHEERFAMVQRDITQEKRLYEQLLRAQKLEAVGTLAGGIAHDFNNLLAAIMGYAEIMQSQLSEEDPFFKPVDIIYKAAVQGAELTKKILSITRKEIPAIKTLDINEAVAASLDLLERSIPKAIEVITCLAPGIPPVLADPSQVQQIIVNLSINARDAMPEGGKLSIVTEYVTAEELPVSGPAADAAGCVKLSISDTGTGMDADTVQKIFDPFFTTKESGKGTGLGLYIVHSIMAKYGGNINVYSEPAKGTRFTLYFPVTNPQDAAPRQQAEDLKGSGTVLIIDDEPHVRELCKDILQPMGYKVLAAGGGSEGIQIFKEMKDRISVVILDMIMPRMGGMEVYEVLKTIHPGVRIIFCSGYSRDGFANIQDIVKQESASFVEKPFSQLTLGRAVKQAVAQGHIS